MTRIHVQREISIFLSLDELTERNGDSEKRSFQVLSKKNNDANWKRSVTINIATNGKKVDELDNYRAINLFKGPNCLRRNCTIVGSSMTDLSLAISQRMLWQIRLNVTKKCLLREQSFTVLCKIVYTIEPTLRIERRSFRYLIDYRYARQFITHGQCASCDSWNFANDVD